MSGERQIPRILIAGLSGDSGKTLVSLGLLLLCRSRGLAVQAFKKGPDYIDPAWLQWASGNPARNLDTYLMGFDGAALAFGSHALTRGINIIEGNRGLYDGSDPQGTHSTAELAKLLNAPVLLVVNAAKTTRTVAATILGCQNLDPDVNIAGVVLNRVSGERHRNVICEAIAEYCGVPVLGVLPRAGESRLLPQRHLGLITPAEHLDAGKAEHQIKQLLEDHIEIDRILELAQQAPGLPHKAAASPAIAHGQGLTIGVIKDSAFSFYYPENLEALEAAGATIRTCSPLNGPAFPKIDALYIGGGFPETHAARLSGSVAFFEALERAARSGLPVYAECGGLMLLSRAIHWKGDRFRMAGVLPFDVEVSSKPQGHGYAELRIDSENPFFPIGTMLRGHEFHYSRIISPAIPPATAAAVLRGTGCFQSRDGVLLGNVWASYTHLHALASPEWPAGLIRAARKYNTRAN
jgi:cobyrinic acid a,c-diamide synthase